MSELSIPIALIVGVLLMAILFAVLIYYVSGSSITMMDDYDSWSEPLLAAIFITFCLITLSVIQIQVISGPPRIYVNLTGVVIPVAICLFLVAKKKLKLTQTLISTGIITLLAIMLVRVEGTSIVIRFPFFLLPAIAAACLAIYFIRDRDLISMISLAYFSATMGMFLGGDIFNIWVASLPMESDINLGVYGLIDFVFLSGVMAVGIVIAFVIIQDRLKTHRAGSMEKRFEI